MISNEYSEKTRRSMAMLSEKEHSFELIEVTFCCSILLSLKISYRVLLYCIVLCCNIMILVGINNDYAAIKSRYFLQCVYVIVTCSC